MHYWWVNQKQTYRQEIAGGFMWSPKKNANGSRSPYYEFMTEVRAGDLIFSYANGQVIAIGVAQSTAFSANKPRDFGTAGESWSNDGWQVSVYFTKAENPITPKNHMSLIAKLLPEKYSPIRPNGKGNQVYLTAISVELGQLLLGLLGNPTLAWPVTNLSDLTFDPEEQELIRDESIRETEKVTLVLARRGQGAYRERVKFFEGACRVTGVDKPELLIASHIKPWRASTNEERLNGHNGLFLSPHLDKLFDAGFMSFEDTGKMLISPLLDQDVLVRWGVDPGRRTKIFRQEQVYFLASHRESVFRP